MEANSIAPYAHPECHSPGTRSRKGRLGESLSPHSHPSPLGSTAPGSLRTGPCLRPPIQTCRPVCEPCQGPRQSHPGEASGARAGVIGATQRAWVGALESRGLVLGRRIAGTPGWDWVCWKASRGTSESPGWLWRLRGAEGRGASGKTRGAPRRWRCTWRPTHHWESGGALSKRSHCGEAPGSVAPGGEKEGGGG